MNRPLKLIGIFLLGILAIIFVPPLSPLLLPISLVALWYFSNKKPNEILKKYARNGALVSAVGLIFIIFADVEPDSEVATITDTEEVITDVEAESDEERLAEEQAKKEAEKEQRKKEARERLAVKREQEKEEREKREQERKEREEEKKKQEEAEQKRLSEANPNKTGETKAPSEPVVVAEGQEDAKVNENIPLFSNDDITSTEVYHQNGPLDSLGRVTAANAVIGVEIMPAEERGNISQHEPTGWNQASYANIGSGGWLYNRSHLIGHQLTGNDDYANLMTGTRWFNMRMLEYENFVANYVETTENHVRYRVTPVFEGNNLIASGAYMEGFSIEDNGEGLMFNIYIPNVQPGVEINYADGSSVGPEGPSQEGEIQQYNPPAQSASGSGGGNATKELPPEPAPQTPPTPAPAPQPAPQPGEYVDENGNGLIKGSSSGIYHVPGSTYYDRTTSPVAWFKTVEEAVNAGYRAPKR